MSTAVANLGLFENSQIIAAYRERTPKSAALAERARAVFPSGITHDSRAIKPYAPYIDHAEGAHKWDVDGHQYVDYFGGHGALILGHNHPQVVAAIDTARCDGTHFGANHIREVLWGEAIQRLVPSAQRVRATASGTEAVILALRLARAYTGRSKVIQLGTHFHGWSDLTIAGFSADFGGPPPRGISQGLLGDSVFVRPRDLQSIERTLSENADIAAVLLEPTGASWGMIPFPEDFVATVRDLTERHGVLLVFDEVVTGFRISPGGAQAALGITPDLTVLAKIVAGGLPGGVVAGRKEIMDALDFDACREAGVEKIEHHGTFNANPLTAAAGAATLGIIEQTDACSVAASTTERLCVYLNECLESARVGWSAYNTASSFYLFLNPKQRPIMPGAFDPVACDWRELKVKPADVAAKLRLALLVNGVDLSGSIGGMVSIAHADKDIERTATALETSIYMLRNEDIPLPPIG